uniref:Class A basic helix-loop-helix protein 15 n=1 Tax=Callorhinchus milii TaxID=7868 RepID=A0A4W3HAJ2_CALMI
APESERGSKRMSESVPGSGSQREGQRARGRSCRQAGAARGTSPSGGAEAAVGTRRKHALSVRERNLRRIESNERERQRMHNLNAAFQALREVIPHVEADKKLSKIETLTLAKNYIKSLTTTILSMSKEPSPRPLSSRELKGSQPPLARRLPWKEKNIRT